MSDIISLFNKWPNTYAPHGMFDMIDLSSPILVGHVTCLIWSTCLINGPILVCHVACLIWLTCLTNGLILVWHVPCLIWLICLTYELIFCYHMSSLLWYFAWLILVLFVWFKFQMSMTYLFNWLLLRLNWPTLQPKSFIEITNICSTLNNIVTKTTLEIKFHPHKTKLNFWKCIHYIHILRSYKVQNMHICIKFEIVQNVNFFGTIGYMSNIAYAMVSFLWINL